MEKNVSLESSTEHKDISHLSLQTSEPTIRLVLAVVTFCACSVAVSRGAALVLYWRGGINTRQNITPPGKRVIHSKYLSIHRIPTLSRATSDAFEAPWSSGRVNYEPFIGVTVRGTTLKQPMPFFDAWIKFQWILHQTGRLLWHALQELKARLIMKPWPLEK